MQHKGGMEQTGTVLGEQIRHAGRDEQIGVISDSSSVLIYTVISRPFLSVITGQAFSGR